MLPGIDVSKYQGRLASSFWRAAYAFGFRVAVVGSWHGLDANPHAEANLHDARVAGFVTATYIALNSKAGDAAVDAGRAACGAEWKYLNFVSLDVEIVGVSLRIIRAAAERCRVLGKRTPVYTANWFWRSKFGNPTDTFLKPLGLWNAYYDGDPDFDFASAPYGPWTLADVVGEQYKGSTSMFGSTVDVNSFRKEWILATYEERLARVEAIAKALVAEDALDDVLEVALQKRDDYIANAGVVITKAMTLIQAGSSRIAVLDALVVAAEAVKADILAGKY